LSRALSAALADSDAAIRLEAARAILRTSEFPAPCRERALAVYREAMSDPDPAVRRALVETICRRPPNGALPGDRREVIPILSVTLEDPDAAVRRSAVQALGRSREPAATAPLVKALTDSDQAVRRAAEQAILLGEFLGRLTPFYYEPFMPQIRAAFRSDFAFFIDWLERGDPELVGQERENSRFRAVVALQWIGEPQVITPLVKALKSKNWRVMWAAAVSLDDLAKDADCLAALGGHLTELQDAMFDTFDHDVRSSTASVLRRFDRALKTAVLNLTGKLNEPRIGARLRAIETLGMLAPGSEEAQAALRRVETEEDNSLVRQIARAELARLEVEKSAAAPTRSPQNSSP
jgi:HEAT repeat protein